MSKNVAVITGANKGLGFATAEELGKKGFTVCMLGRNKQAIESAAAKLKSSGIDAHAYVADVSNDLQVEEFGRKLAQDFNHVDVLVNNAGLFLDPMDFQNQERASILATKTTLISESFNTNTLSAIRMAQALAPLLKKSKHGRVVNVSSGMGQLSEMNAYYPAYRLSKTALNAVTRILSEEFEEFKIKVNSVCPGWVKTEMGGEHAEREIPEGISGIIWAATLPDNGPTGGFFRDGERIDW